MEGSRVRDEGAFFSTNKITGATKTERKSSEIDQENRRETVFDSLLSSMESRALRVKYIHGDKNSGQIEVERETLNHGRSRYPAKCAISFQPDKGAYEYSCKSQLIGTECQDDATCYVNSAEEAVAMTLKRFARQSVEFDGWEIPSYLHPEWTDSQLQDQIYHAEIISAAEQISRRARFYGFPDPRRHQLPVYYFLPVRHRYESSVMLLRKGSGGALIMRDSPDNFLIDTSLDCMVRHHCLKAIGIRIVPWIIGRIMNPGCDCKSGGCQLLGEFIGQDNGLDAEVASKGIDALAILAMDPQNERIQRSAILALGQAAARCPQAVQVLRDMLPNAGLEAAQSISQALGLAGPAASDSVPDLLTYVANRFPMAEEEVVWALGRIASHRESVLPKLREFFCKSKGRACGLIPWAMHRLRADALPLVLDLLKSNDLGDCETAVEIIDTMGQHAREAIPELEQVYLKCPRGRLRSIAKEAIWHICRPKPFAPEVDNWTVENGWPELIV